MADAKEDGFQRQAQTVTDRNFERQRRDLERLQGQEARDRERARERERQSFTENQDKALADHRAQVAAIDRREERAMQTLLDRQRSLGGRIIGLVRGRKHQLGQQEALKEQFEAQRVAKHRQLAQLQERQQGAEQKARDRHIKEHKAMHERHDGARKELAEWQADRRETAVKDHIRAQAEQALKQPTHVFDQSHKHRR